MLCQILMFVLVMAGPSGAQGAPEIEIWTRLTRESQNIVLVQVLGAYKPIVFRDRLTKPTHELPKPEEYYAGLLVELEVKDILKSSEEGLQEAPEIIGLFFPGPHLPDGLPILQDGEQYVLFLETLPKEDFAKNKGAVIVDDFSVPARDRELTSISMYKPIDTWNGMVHINNDEKKLAVIRRIVSDSRN
jgi:hypothetical protein